MSFNYLCLWKAWQSDFALIIYRPQIKWMVKSGDDILRVCQIL